MRFLKYPFVALLLLVPSLLFGFDRLPLNVHLDVAGLTRAGAPRVVGNYVLFTYPPREGVHFVGVAFAGQDFRTVHSFFRNGHGVFFYLYPVPEKSTTIVYRFVVDGLWQSDPRNPDKEIDPSGIVLSKFLIPARRIEVTTSPLVHSDGSVQFFFKAPAGRVITVAGDFNDWDPFMNPMTRLSNGYYTATLRLPPGTHAYYFVSDGAPVADPLDPLVDYQNDGTKISVFTVP